MNWLRLSHRPPSSTYANSTNICPIRRLVRCQTLYRMRSIGPSCPILICRSLSKRWAWLWFLSDRDNPIRIPWFRRTVRNPVFAQALDGVWTGFPSRFDPVVYTMHLNLTIISYIILTWMTNVLVHLRRRFHCGVPSQFRVANLPWTNWAVREVCTPPPWTDRFVHRVKKIWNTLYIIPTIGFDLDVLSQVQLYCATCHHFRSCHLPHFPPSPLPFPFNDSTSPVWDQSRPGPSKSSPIQSE